MEKSKKAVIFGTGSFGEVAWFYLTHDSEYEVVAFTENPVSKETLKGLPVVDFSTLEKSHPPESYEILIAVGASKLGAIRREFSEKAKEKGYRLIRYICSKATVWTEDIGENCFIFEDNTIQPFVSIGKNTVLWSGNHIGHHTRIDDDCFITSHVVISGHCHVKKNSFLGVNATLRDGITIGEYNIIGANALIMKNTSDNDVYVPEKTKLFPKRSDQIRSL